METLRKIIKKNVKKNESSLNRYKVLEDTGKDIDKWCRRRKDTKECKEEIERLETMTTDQMLEEIDKIIILKLDRELNKRKEPRLYEGN